MPQTQPQPHDHDDPEQLRIRKEKRAQMLADGRSPYPTSVARTHSLAEVRAAHPALEAGAETDDIVGVAGRVVFQRNTGKLCFVTLQAGDGTRLQGMLSLAEVGEESLDRWKHDVDLGDHVFLHGRVIMSKRGELSIMVDDWAIASKSLRPLPTLHTELTDETRMRQRYIDLITRDQARETVRVRAEVMKSLRKTFDLQGYMEIETPMLQTIHGGAAARPFSTHINAYDMQLYLRIAPELFLKRALVGGLDNIFEINKNFRNEGADSTHSPEFAMLEAYQAYGDFETIGALTKTLVQNAALDAFDSHLVTLADGSEYDVGGEWRTISMYPSLSEKLGVEVTPDTTVEELEVLALTHGIDLEGVFRLHGKYVEEMWEHFHADELYAPTFVTGFPVDTSPLTKSDRNDPGIVEKWDLYVRGFELATGYSELNDPVVQRERFEAQARDGAAGDGEAMRVDEDFLMAMEYGMPPAGGMGMGVDRLLMTLTGLGIRDTILFPLVKPIAD